MAFDCIGVKHDKNGTACDFPNAVLAVRRAFRKYLCQPRVDLTPANNGR
jgi:hypothetical protein